MMNTTQLKQHISNRVPILYSIKFAVGLFIIFSLAFILLKFPENSANGIRNGIELCLDTLIPTLYPFMILTNVFVNSGLINKKNPLLSKTMDFLFKLPAESAAVILFSMIGGLPIGAKMTQKLYLKGKLTREQGERMLCFCVNPGPAFVISTVGYYMLGSKQVGVLIYVSLIASSLTLGIISGLFRRYSEVQILKKNENENMIKNNIMQQSITDASKSILYICSWIVAFSCISEMINILTKSDDMRIFLQSIAEMTNGCKVTSEYFTPPILAAIIGFSGFCGHLQLMDSIVSLKMKYKYFFVSRVINASIAAVYCSLLLKLFPVVSETFSAGVLPSRKGTSVSIFTSILMIIMATLFILGDDYSVKRKKKVKTNI